MAIKIIPRERVYFSEWVEANGIEIEVCEQSNNSWIARVENCTLATTPHYGVGCKADKALQVLILNLQRLGEVVIRKDGVDGPAIKVPQKFDPDPKNRLGMQGGDTIAIPKEWSIATPVMVRSALHDQVEKVLVAGIN